MEIEEDVIYRGYQVCLYYATTLPQQNTEKGLMKEEEWKVNFNRVKKTFYK